MHLLDLKVCVIVSCLADSFVLTVCMCVTLALQMICHQFQLLPWQMARVDHSLPLSMAGLMGETILRGTTTATSMVLCFSKVGWVQKNVDPLANYGTAMAQKLAPTLCIVMGSATSRLTEITGGIVTGLTIQLPGMHLTGSVALLSSCRVDSSSHMTTVPSRQCRLHVKAPLMWQGWCLSACNYGRQSLVGCNIVLRAGSCSSALLCGSVTLGN